jgi:uracil phosphoribosyltransferase
MTFALELKDERALYESLSRGQIPKQNIRDTVSRLGTILARHMQAAVERRMGTSGQILCAVILRSGAMLYPGFLSAFSDADFCMLGLERDGDGDIVCNYVTRMRAARFDLCIYIDCIAASGRTLLAARQHLREHCHIEQELAALICCSADAMQMLRRNDMGVIGFSLNESLKGNVVTPDFGELDAGELFNSSR